MIQVAELCANDGGFLQLCGSITCPQAQDSCIASPTYQGQSLETNLQATIDCSLAFAQTPYTSGAARTTGISAIRGVIIMTAVCFSYVILSLMS